MGHILVVEDDPALIGILQSALPDWGHTMTVARDGPDGYRKIAISAQDFDVILCDLNLPRMRGREMLERIGTLIRGRTPVIVMSGLPDLLEALRETSQIAFSVLAKPFENLNLVRDMIQSALRQGHLLRALADKDAQIEDLKGRVEFLANQAMSSHAEARRDPLTSLATRIQLSDDIRVLNSAPSHLSTSAMLCLIDMDNFRRFNAEGGYGAGDEAIQRTAAALERCSRGRDQIYRWGGDEFVALICCEDLQTGVGIVDRLREEVAAQSRVLGHEPSITFSAGVISIPAHGNDPLRMMIDDAARYLKQAKAEGGNCVASRLGVVPDTGMRPLVPHR